MHIYKYPGWKLKCYLKYESPYIPIKLNNFSPQIEKSVWHPKEYVKLYQPQNTFQITSKFKHILHPWAAVKIWAKMGSGNSLLPDDTKP